MDATKKCWNCNTLLPPNIGKKVNNRWICDDCFDDAVKECSRCKESALEDYCYILASGDYVCDTCYDEYYFSCESCDDAYHTSERIHTAQGDSICERCYENYYFRCDNCEDVFHVDSYHNGLCGYCHRQREDEDRIRNYGFKPAPVFHGAKGSRQFGFELEIECEGSPNSMATSLLEEFDHENIYYLKDDASIDNGFEIVTHPHDLGSHYRAYWQEMFSFLVKNHCRSHNTKTCGLHVHVSADKIPYTTRVKLDLFVNLNRDMMVKFARRSSSSYAQFKNIYKKKIRRNCGRYDGFRGAINFGNMIEENDTNTIEFRMFRGSLKYNTVMAAIEFVDLAVDFCNITPTPAFVRIGLWSKFYKFCMERKTHPHIRDYISLRGITSEE